MSVTTSSCQNISHTNPDFDPFENDFSLLFFILHTYITNLVYLALSLCLWSLAHVSVCLLVQVWSVAFVCITLNHMIGWPPSWCIYSKLVCCTHGFLRCLLHTKRRYSTRWSVSVHFCHCSSRNFTLRVDCFLLTDNGIGDSPNQIHSASRLLTQIVVISSPGTRLIIGFTKIQQSWLSFRVKFGNSVPPRYDSTTFKTTFCQV
jgi:hypothetical protein